MSANYNDMVAPITTIQLSAARRERDIAERKLALEQLRTGTLREALNLAINAPADCTCLGYPQDPQCERCTVMGQARALARIAE